MSALVLDKLIAKVKSTRGMIELLPSSCDTNIEPTKASRETVGPKEIEKQDTRLLWTFLIRCIANARLD